jgi:hypothetical protein
MPASGFGDELPRPDFLLRDKKLQGKFLPGVEFVGEPSESVSEVWSPDEDEE